MLTMSRLCCVWCLPVKGLSCLVFGTLMLIMHFSFVRVFLLSYRSRIFTYFTVKLWREYGLMSGRKMKSTRKLRKKYAFFPQVHICSLTFALTISFSLSLSFSLSPSLPLSVLYPLSLSLSPSLSRYLHTRTSNLKS